MILIYYKTWIYQCLSIQVKSPSIDMVSRPGLDLDPPIGSDRDSGRDNITISFFHTIIYLLDFIPLICTFITLICLLISSLMFHSTSFSSYLSHHMLHFLHYIIIISTSIGCSYVHGS